MKQVSDAVLDGPVTGTNLVPGVLRDQLGGTPTLLVFLRHFGCLFCRETVADLRAIAEGAPDYPPILFFTQSSSTELRAFLRRDWPGARAVADPGRHFYAAFGVDRISPLDLLRSALWSAARRARAKGHERDERTGDIWRLPGVFLVQGSQVLWNHEFQHAGDHPEWDRIPALVAANRREPT